MKSKKLLSLCLAGALSVTALCYPLSSSATVDYTYKIDEALAEKLDSIGNNDTVDVSVWFKGVSDSELNKNCLTNIIREVKNNHLDKNILELSNLSNLNTNSKKTNKDVTIKDIRKMLSIKRNTTTKLNKSYNTQRINHIISNGKVDTNDVLYVDELMPNVEMNLTKDEIYDLVSEKDVEAIYNCAEIEFPKLSNTSVTTNSVMTNTINSTIYDNTGIASLKESYDGSDISIGIISDKRPNLELDAICEANVLAPKHAGENLDIDKGTSDLSNFIATQLVGNIGNYEGIAPEATLYFRASDTSHWKSDINYLVLDKNVDMLCLFFEGVDATSGTYGDIAKWIDALVNNNNITVVQPVNKNINTSVVSAPAMAYNAIAVGGASGTSSISAYNTDGLSFKPDIVAPCDMSVKYDTGINTVTLGNTASSAGLVTGAIALLMDAENELITSPHLTKSILLNGATYYGTKNSSYSINANNPNSSFVAYDRVTGAGSINIYNSFCNFVSRSWDVGTLNAGQETFSGSFIISEANKEVHITFCAIKNNTFNGDGSATDRSCPNITMTVKHGNQQWTSTVTTDNKCSIVFNTDANQSVSSGTYNIYLESDTYVSKSALSHNIY